jgi:hypothetical protein
MQWKNIFARIIITFFTSCLLAGIGALALGLLSGGVALIAAQSFHAFLIGGLVGGVGGFFIGGYHGFQLGTFFYKRFVEKDLDWPEPQFLSGRKDTLSIKKTLLEELSELPDARPTRLLTKNEIEIYRKIVKDKDDRLARDKLNHYEDFIEDTSKFATLNADALQLRVPVTIENTREQYYLAKTYEKDFLIDILQKQGKSLREPIKGYPLFSPTIKFYAGYPQWIPSFVQNVLLTIRFYRKEKKEQELLRDNKVTQLFSPRASFQPSLNSIPEKKMKV